MFMLQEGWQTKKILFSIVQSRNRIKLYNVDAMLRDNLGSNILFYDTACRIRRERGRVVSASDSQSGDPGFKSRSGHLEDFCSVFPSSNPRPSL